MVPSYSGVCLVAVVEAAFDGPPVMDWLAFLRSVVVETVLADTQL